MCNTHSTSQIQDLFHVQRCYYFLLVANFSASIVNFNAIFHSSDLLAGSLTPLRCLKDVTKPSHMNGTLAYINVMKNWRSYDYHPLPFTPTIYTYHLISAHYVLPSRFSLGNWPYRLSFVAKCCVSPLWYLNLRTVKRYVSDTKDYNCDVLIHTWQNVKLARCPFAHCPLAQC